MSDRKSERKRSIQRVVRSLALGALYLLASPTYLLRWIITAFGAAVRARRLRADAVRCPHCGTVNPLDLLATCRNCGRVEYGSRVWCSNCKEIVPSFACDRCGAMIDLL